MNWYYAVAGEQKGPLPQEQFDQLVAQGVITESTLVWSEGMAAWQPWSAARQPVAAAPPMAGENPNPSGDPASLASVAGGIACAECGRLFPEEEVARFSNQAVCAACKPRFLQRLTEGAPKERNARGVSLAEVLARDLPVDLGKHWNRAWAVFKERPGLMIGATAVTYLLIMAASVIPIISMVAPIFLQGPIFGGLFLVNLRLLRRDPADLGNLFDGFRNRYWQLVLTQFIQGLITMAILAPFIIALLVPIFIFAGQAQAAGQFNWANIGAPMIALMVVMGLLTMVVGLLLSLTWMFSIPLVADRGMDFWPAMELSRKLTWRRLGGMLLFLIALMALNLAGLLVACLGLLVTVPVSTMMLASLFEDLAGDLDVQKR